MTEIHEVKLIPVEFNILDPEGNKYEILRDEDGVPHVLSTDTYNRGRADYMLKESIHAVGCCIGVNYQYAPTGRTFTFDELADTYSTQQRMRTIRYVGSSAIPVRIKDPSSEPILHNDELRRIMSSL